MLLWLAQKVEVLEFHAQTVHSASKTFQLPSVLRLNQYIHQKFTNSIRFCRDNVYLRDNYTCQYCHKEFPRRKLTLDHVQPLSRGGTNSWGNVVAACGPCNNKKADKTPKEAGMPLLKAPTRPKHLTSAMLPNNSEGCPPSWLNYLPFFNVDRKF